jgi:hypothetical protein
MVGIERGVARGLSGDKGSGFRFQGSERLSLITSHRSLLFLVRPLL